MLQIFVISNSINLAKETQVGDVGRAGGGGVQENLLLEVRKNGLRMQQQQKATGRAIKRYKWTLQHAATWVDRQLQQFGREGEA